MAYITLTQLADRPGAVELAQVATPRQYRQVDAELLDALVVVAGDHHLVRVRQRAQHLVERDERRVAAARAEGDVARVAQHVAVRNVDLVELAVSVGDEDDAHCLSSWCLWNSRRGRSFGSVPKGHSSSIEI